MDKLKLDGKVALVTGSSSGIGAAAAIYLSELGAQLVLTVRNADNLETVAQKCIAANPKYQPLVIAADVSKEEDVKNLVKQTVDKFGKLDILINNAGVGGFGTLETSTLEQFDHIINTNLRSVFYLTQLCAPYLEKTRGSIVNVGSVAGLRPYVTE